MWLDRLREESLWWEAFTEHPRGEAKAETALSLPQSHPCQEELSIEVNPPGEADTEAPCGHGWDGGLGPRPGPASIGFSPPVLERGCNSGNWGGDSRGDSTGRESRQTQKWLLPPASLKALLTCVMAQWEEQCCDCLL